MNVKKSQRAFVGVTLTTVLGLTVVLLVYAATLFSLQGGEVTILGNVGGNITYSSDNVDPGTWTAELTVPTTGNDWYVRLVTNAGGYAGPATITWQLQLKDGLGTYNDVVGAFTESDVVLTTLSQTFYASSDGTITLNRDWSLTATSTGSYRVTVLVESTG